MPSLDNYIAFRCQNADCAALVKMKPPQPGKDFIIVCPKCKTRQKWQYEGIDSQCKPVVVPKGIVRSEPKAEPKVEPDRPTPIGFMRLSPIPGRLYCTGMPTMSTAFLGSRSIPLHQSSNRATAIVPSLYQQT